MSVNYTEDQVKHMVEAYTARPERATVDAGAEQHAVTADGSADRYAKDSG